MTTGNAPAPPSIELLFVLTAQTKLVRAIGATILLLYAGRAGLREDGKVHIEVGGNFEAPQGPYTWLNNVQTFGLGEALPDGVRYHFYCFS
jgi:hypothetical protein